jgi:hypothetical protein
LSLPDFYPATVDGLQLRAILGRREWQPPERFGPDGWQIVRNDRAISIIVSAAPEDDGTDWIHASIARHDGTMPTYDDLQLLHKAVFADGWAYQVFAPTADHVNIHQHALHLFGRTDGQQAIPNFGRFGTI